MSFQFSPETLIFEIQNKIKQVTNDLTLKQAQIKPVPQPVYEDRRFTYTTHPYNNWQTVEQSRVEKVQINQDEVQNTINFNNELQSQISNLESQLKEFGTNIGLLQKEADVRRSYQPAPISNNTTFGAALAGPTQKLTVSDLTPSAGQAKQIPVLPIIAAVGIGLLVFVGIRKKRK